MQHSQLARLDPHGPQALVVFAQQRQRGSKLVARMSNHTRLCNMKLADESICSAGA